MVPPFATAHTFYSSRVLCVVYNYAEIEDLGNGFWNSKSKLEIATHYSELIKLLFGKNAIHCYFKAS